MTLEGVILVAILAIGLGWGVWRVVLWWKRRGRLRDEEQRALSHVSAGGQRPDAPLPSAASAGDDELEIAARKVLEARPANPLAILADLRLEDALDLKRYGEAVTGFGDCEHRLEIEAGGGVITVATNVLDLSKAGTELTFELSSSIRAGLVKGTLRLARDQNGKLLATVQDTRTGRITELLRGAPKSARLGALTATVYGLAHLVSAQDLATKLDAISGKVDLLLALRSIDQRARLEAVYASVPLACA